MKALILALALLSAPDALAETCPGPCPPGTACRMGWGSNGPHYQCLEKSRPARPNMGGTYLMKIQIGPRLFEDILVLEGEVPLKGNSPLKCTLTVPGVFTASLEGEAMCTAQGCELNFHILAKENGQEFAVLYTAILGPGDYESAIEGEPVRLHGTAALEKGVLLGKFEAIQQK